MGDRGIYVHNRWFNTAKSTLLCQTPDGTLYQKRGSSREFYLYNANGETNAKKYVPVSWSDASNYVKTYGTKQQWIDKFTVMDKDTGTKNSGKTMYDLDPYHRLKAQRNADRLGMTVTGYIKYLIDRDDDNRNY